MGRLLAAIAGAFVILMLGFTVMILMGLTIPALTVAEFLFAFWIFMAGICVGLIIGT
jgi:hypothetical protein